MLALKCNFHTTVLVAALPKVDHKFFFGLEFGWMLGETST